MTIKFTPDVVYQLIHRILKNLTDLIARIILKRKFLHLRLGVTAMSLSALFLSFYFLVTLNSEMTGNSTTFFETRYFWIIPTLVPLALITEFIVGLAGGSRAMAVLCAFSMAFLMIPEIASYGDYSYIPMLIRATMFFVLAVHILVLLTTRSLGINERLMIFFVVELFLVSYLFFSGQSFFSESFWVTQPYRYIFMFSVLAADQKKDAGFQFMDRQFFSYILSPTNFITPLPILFRQWRVDEDRHRFKPKASLYLILGLLSLLATVWLQKTRNSFSYYHHGTWSFLPLAGAMNYLYFFFFSYTNITVPIALLWWFGFNIPDAYDLPLLATNPQDRWRRWNLYFYDWYFRFIFFPVYKFSQSYFVAIMAVFAATLFIHLGPHNTEIFIYLENDSFSRGFLKKFLFFTLHGVLVYLGIKLGRYLPTGDKISGWFGVTGMFVIMSYLHYIFML